MLKEFVTDSRVLRTEEVVIDLSSSMTLFSRLSPKTKGYIDIQFYLDKAETNCKCIHCRKEIKKGCLVIRPFGRKDSVCKGCYKKVLFNGKEPVPHRLVNLTRVQLEALEYVYRKVVTESWIKGYAFYQKPLELIGRILNESTYVEQVVGGIQLKVKGVKHDFLGDMAQLACFYFYAKLVNIHRKVVARRSTVPIGSCMKTTSGLHHTCYIEDVFCPISYVRMDATRIMAEDGREKVLYTSPSYYGHVFVLDNFERLYERGH